MSRIEELETALAEARQEVEEIAEVSRHAKGERDHANEQNRQVWELLGRYKIAARGFRGRDDSVADVFAAVVADLTTIRDSKAYADDGVDYDDSADDK